ncbi:MAG TPA: general stress protein [Intrasporangium sp.]|uniref:general stress protein n=1 Tax=Intrasporangium sp. TaxID=1925024 RepID=UPI002D79EB42|nr:general stress protein [Intrasporangium sp.]HET7399587.1 general stress protein [Intrasporangium sp.]
MSMQPKGPGQRPGFPTLSLEYPLSLGTFDKYEDAQRAVDTLSDKQFPVQNCLIVGTDLKQLERVTARLTWGRVALGGILSGLWLGLFVGLIFALFNQQESAMALLLSTALYGALFGLVWSLVGYAFTRGARDFQSVSQVVATKYEVFVEHKFAQQGREILAEAGIYTSGGHAVSTPSFSSSPVTAPTGTPTVPPAGPVPPRESEDRPAE